MLIQIPRTEIDRIGRTNKTFYNYINQSYTRAKEKGESDGGSYGRPCHVPGSR